MAKLNIIYWSGTGNTEKMAEYIGEGAKESGAEVNIIDVNRASEADLDADIIALGSPSMGAEEVEAEMEEFIDKNSEKFSGKRLGLFGSHDWGDGDWMESWVENMKNLNAEVVGEGCVVNLLPEGEEADKCKEYGKTLVSEV